MVAGRASNSDDYGVHKQGTLNSPRHSHDHAFDKPENKPENTPSTIGTNLFHLPPPKLRRSSHSPSLHDAFRFTPILSLVQEGDLSSAARRLRTRPHHVETARSIRWAPFFCSQRENPLNSMGRWVCFKGRWVCLAVLVAANLAKKVNDMMNGHEWAACFSLRHSCSQ